eukprot:scaffold12254_cov17-Tisochrysis_lutea.AAC.1
MQPAAELAVVPQVLFTQQQPVPSTNYHRRRAGCMWTAGCDSPPTPSKSTNLLSRPRKSTIIAIASMENILGLARQKYATTLLPTVASQFTTGTKL